MSTDALSFLRPWWLLSLLPLAILIWRLWRLPDRGTAAWRRLVDAHLLPHLLIAEAPGRRRSALALFGCGLLLAVFALAGPAVDPPAGSAYRRDAMRVLVLDLSAGKGAQTPSLLETLKLKILALLRALPEGETALLVYAGEPYLIVPPSTDVETLALLVPELESDLVPVPGNRPELALRMAGKLLARNGGAGMRDVLWISAGANEVKLPSAELAGARLSILYAGAAPDRALTEVVQASGGSAVALSGDDRDARQLAALLSSRSAWIAEGSRGRGQADLGYWMLLLLLPLAALVFRQGILMLLVVPTLWLLSPAPAEAADFSPAASFADYAAWRRLESGDASAVAERFKDRRWRAVANYRLGRYQEAAALLAGEGDADSLYNRGNALARQGRLAEALSAYEAALGLRPGDDDIRHNHDLVQRLVPPPRGGAQGASEQPRPKPPGASAKDGEAEREAARLAEQWLRRVPDEPYGLLRRKLLSEHKRRLAAEVDQPW